MKYQTKSRKFLEEVCGIEIDPVTFKWVQKKAFNKGYRPLKIWIQAKTHKYGNTVVYEYINFYNPITHKGAIMSYHSFIYAYMNGEVPAGYDVDHIDGDTLNNSIDNLQLLTREENLKKRKLSQKEISKNYREIEKNIKNCNQNIV